MREIEIEKEREVRGRENKEERGERGCVRERNEG